MMRTRIVQWLRIILPLAALALLSTLFVFSGNKEEESGLPYATVTVEDLATRPKVMSPTYAGVALDGTEIEMTAESADPGQEGGQSRAAHVALKLTDPEGRVSNLTAESGAMTDHFIELRDNVRLTTSTGWVLTSDAFDAEIDSGSLTSRAPVEAEAPFGKVTAKEMDLRGKKDSPGEHVLDLKGDVRMIYQP